MTTDVFSRGSGTTSLAASPAVGVTKEICRPDADAADGCDWISNASIKVGVPPSATSIKYRVTIANTGNADLAGVIAYDVLPYLGDTGTTTATAGTPRGSTVREQLAGVSGATSGLTLAYSTSTNPPRPEVYTGPTSGGWTADPVGSSAIRATVGALAPGQTRSFVYEASLVGGSADQVACNSIAVTANGLVAVEPAAVCATTQEADFSVAPTYRYPLQAGRVGTIPFVVQNGGGSDSATATVTISVPADIDLVTLDVAGWQCTTSSMSGPATVTCGPVTADGTTRSLDRNVPETIALPVRPTDTAPATVCFDATVDGLMYDPDLANNTAQSCSTAITGEPELLVSKDDGRTSVSVGEEYTYTIGVSSRLVAEALDSVTLTDTLPAAVEFVSADPAPNSLSGQQLSWSIGRLEPAGIPGDAGDGAGGGAGSATSVTVTVRVAAGAKDAVANTAVASAPDPADPGRTLTAEGTDTDTVRNVFTEGNPTETTPQNVAVATDLSDIVAVTGAPLDPTTVTQQDPPDHGVISVDAGTGTVTYTPDAGYTGPDSYSVKVCDTSDPAQCHVSTVTVTVGANVVTATDDSDTTTATTAVTTDVLANDTTASGQPLDVPTVTGGPARGTAVPRTDGTITYAPDAGFSGTDSYTYRVCDTSLPDPVCDSATVTITIRNVFTDGPAADGNAGIETPQNTAIITPLNDIVSAAGAAPDPTSVTEQSGPRHGSIGIDPDTGAVTYTPDDGYSGPDTYSVRVCDTSIPEPQCHMVTVAVTVLPNVIAARDLRVDTRVNTPAGPVDVLTPAVSSSGQPFDLPVIATDPGHGAATINADGTISYTPADGFEGTDSFTYTVCDTGSPQACDTATIVVSVSPVADLATTKSVDTDTVVAGLPITYTATLTNHGPSTATDVHSIDPIDKAVLDATGTPDSGFPDASCETRSTTEADLALLNPEHGPYAIADYPAVVDCTYPSVPAGTSVHDTISGTVDAAAAPGGLLRNQVASFSGTYDPDLSDNVGEAFATITAAADVTVTKVADVTDVGVGDDVTFTITVVNHGPSVADGVAVHESPTGMELGAAQVDQGSYAGQVWTIGALSVGQRVSMTVTGTVTGTAAINVATGRSGTPDPDSGNDGGSDCVAGDEGCGVVVLAVHEDTTAPPTTADPVTTPAGGDLAETGTDLAGYLQIALLLLLAGGGTLALSHGSRRSREH